MGISARGPTLTLDGKALTSVPDLDKAREADSQAEATLYSKPRFEGGDLNLSLGKGGEGWQS